jgi:multidrug efflux pump subunit AcrA (membrane-fusion protein)
MTTDIGTMTVQKAKDILADLETKLSDAKAQRDRILIDVRKATAAADAGDQRACFAQGGLNKEDAAAGRLILSLEAQVAEAKKRLEMAEAQAATVEAKRASADAGAVPHDRLFEVTTPDGRVVRHRHESAGALQKALTPGYLVVAEVFGAGIDDKGGMIEPIGQSTMKTLLAAHGDELVAFLAERGIKAA